MNKTFTVFTNQYCSSDNDFEQVLEEKGSLSPTLNENRFFTFTKCKIKSHSRYFDSPTMNTLDDDDDDDDDRDIPVSRCSNKIPAVEPSLNETDLSDLLIFTNPNRVMNESMQVVISRHPSLHDFKYVNDVSSVLVAPPVLILDKEEPIYQELMQIEQSVSTLVIDQMDEDKENRPPLMPIDCQASRIPARTPSSINRVIKQPETMYKNKKHDEVKKKTTTKQSLTDLLDEWSFMSPKLKNLLSSTHKMPLRMPQLTPHSVEFRRLKQLLNEMELLTSSWTHAINQCRSVLRQAQQQTHRS